MHLPTAAFLRPPIASLSAPTSAYIHLPFCAQRCAYCAFPVLVSGRASLPAATHHPPPPQAHLDYVDVLCREIRAVASRWPSRPRAPLSTLYLGGGTPSLLHPDLLARVLRLVRRCFGLAPDAEVTCEMDPATFTAHTAREYRALGVNRASVGAQSFDDHLLAACRRVHRARDIHLAVDALRDARFENISLDLISGLPEHAMETWRASLQQALRLNPEHVSSYDLTLEQGTSFGNKYRQGEGPLPSEALAAQMMTVAASVLGDAGYEHYEISNFARRPPQPKDTMGKRSTSHNSHSSPFRSRHNMAYWRNEPFYAFGLGATSVVDGFRFARPRRLSDYVQYVDGLTKFAESPEMSRHDRLEAVNVTQTFYPHLPKMSNRERLEDYLINSFRLLVEGVSLDEVHDLFGATASGRLARALDKLSALEEQGSIRVERDESGPRSVALTEQGALIENSVLSTIMQEAVWKHPEDSASMSLETAT